MSDSILPPASEWPIYSDELPFDEWKDFDFDTAALTMAEAAVKYDAYLSNEEGAANTRAMRALFAEAQMLYDQITDAGI